MSSGIAQSFLEKAARWLQPIVDRRRRTDGLLQSAQTWETQYAAGRWDFLAQLSELARFSVLVGYICHLKPGGSVLDAGCGQGVLLSRLPSTAYSSYVGIELSSSAVSVAQQRQIERSSFLVANCEEFCPQEQYDVIVFNEVLCCLSDPLRTVGRYADYLNPGGILLVSMCTAARGSTTILWALKGAYDLIDEVRIGHPARNVSWVCAAFGVRSAPHPAARCSRAAGI